MVIPPLFAYNDRIKPYIGIDTYRSNNVTLLNWDVREYSSIIFCYNTKLLTA